MISPYQYERLEYIIDHYQLTYEDLSMTDNFIADPNMDDKIDWLIRLLRKRPYRNGS